MFSSLVSKDIDYKLFLLGLFFLASAPSISILFFFRVSSVWCKEIVSGDVKFELIILSLYFIPNVPIDATGILFKSKI